MKPPKELPDIDAWVLPPKSGFLGLQRRLNLRILEGSAGDLRHSQD